LEIIGQQEAVVEEVGEGGQVGVQNGLEHGVRSGEAAEARILATSREDRVLFEGGWEGGREEVRLAYRTVLSMA